LHQYSVLNVVEGYVVLMNVPGLWRSDVFIEFTQKIDIVCILKVNESKEKEKKISKELCMRGRGL